MGTLRTFMEGAQVVSPLPHQICCVTTSLTSEGDADSGRGVWRGHQTAQSGLGCPPARAGELEGRRVQAALGWGRASGLFLQRLAL